MAINRSVVDAEYTSVKKRSVRVSTSDQRVVRVVPVGGSGDAVAVQAALDAHIVATVPHPDALSGMDLGLIFNNGLI